MYWQPKARPFRLKTDAVSCLEVVAFSPFLKGLARAWPSCVISRALLAHSNETSFGSGTSGEGGSVNLRLPDDFVCRDLALVRGSHGLFCLGSRAARLSTFSHAHSLCHLEWGRCLLPSDSFRHVFAEDCLVNKEPSNKWNTTPLVIDLSIKSRNQHAQTSGSRFCPLFCLLSCRNLSRFGIRRLPHLDIWSRSSNFRSHNFRNIR